MINVLGDAIGAGLVNHLSQADLETLQDSSKDDPSELSSSASSSSTSVRKSIISTDEKENVVTPC